MAIASLITGICGFLAVTPLVSIGLGIGALADIRRTGRPGKGLAITGLILSVLWIALFVTLAVLGYTHGDTGTTPPVGNQNPDGTSA
jgi:hypothetical protein